jgi:hypothetical protein
MDVQVPWNHVVSKFYCVLIYASQRWLNLKLVSTHSNSSKFPHGSMATYATVLVRLSFKRSWNKKESNVLHNYGKRTLLLAYRQTWIMKMAVFWVVAAGWFALMMEAASTFQTSVNFYQTTRRNNPEDSHLHIRRREKPKSQPVLKQTSLGDKIKDNEMRKACSTHGKMRTCLHTIF